MKLEMNHRQIKNNHPDLLVAVCENRVDGVEKDCWNKNL